MIMKWFDLLSKKSEMSLIDPKIKMGKSWLLVSKKTQISTNYDGITIIPLWS